MFKNGEIMIHLSIQSLIYLFNICSKQSNLRSQKNVFYFKKQWISLSLSMNGDVGACSAKSKCNFMRQFDVIAYWCKSVQQDAYLNILNLLHYILIKLRLTYSQLNFNFFEKNQ